MKYIAFIFLLCSGHCLIDAQVSMKVIVKEKIAGYNIGDTVTVLGCHVDFGGNPDYLIRKSATEVLRISSNKFTIVQKISDFWQDRWFYERSFDVIANGMDQKIRTQLQTDCRHYINNLQVNRLLFNDDYLKDYLLQLVHKICPKGLVKGDNDFLNVFVMKSDEPKSVSFDNGTIILTTALLANTKNEKELVQTLSNEIARIYLDYNYQNIQRQIRNQNVTSFMSLLADLASSTLTSNNEDNNRLTFDDAIAVTSSVNLLSSNILESQGAIYSDEQNKHTLNLENLYISEYYDKQPDHKSPDEYNRYISKILTFTAWQNFYSLKYKMALDLLNRLENASCSEENDLLLKAKIYRTIYNTDESNYEALRCLKAANNIGIAKILDISKEEGLIYLRLNDKVNARIALEEYKNGLENLPVLKEDDNNELEWVKDVLYKTQ